MDYQPGMIGDGSCIIKPITIGMVQTVKNRMSKLKNKFGFIIVDECHRTPSTTFQKVITAFNSKYLLGLSATAWRNDGLDSLIHLALGPRTHKIENAELIENGSILRPEIKIRYTDFEYNFKGDYGEMLSTLTKDPKRNMQIIDDVRNNLNNGTNLIVSDRIYHLRLLQTLLNEPGSQMLIGETKTDERKEIIDKVNSGEIKTLFSTFQLLGEGFDCSGLTNLFIASPFKYSGRLVQIAGRVMRPAPGKTAKIYDYVDKKQPVLLIQSAKRKSAFEKIIGA
jgi:superfamily II DNA or RNA helicase